MNLLGLIRYLRLDPSKAASLRVQAGGGGQAVDGGEEGGPDLRSAQQWDGSLRAVCADYGLMDYNIMGRNCHQFVSDFLNAIQYQGSSRWTMVHLVRWFV